MKGSSSMADSNSYPMISEKNWWTIREKFKASLPAIATPNYVKTLLTLSSDSSANSNVITPMRRIGLLDEENKPTALANDWRLDNKYKALRRKTEKLFKDGHHARAVEEAYKLLDNTVKVKAGLQQTDLTGAKLMQTAFSPNKPLLRLNECVSTSEQNEQSGYMQILAGCMVGIRNPRAHDSDWEDTEERSLQLLSFANHLMERILVSEKVDY